jgi:DNA-directed RNA polymerase subunit alpha
MLSSIPGAGVTSLRIDGVNHEFSTIDGVTEDVTELIMNIKELAISSVLDEPQIATIAHKGAGEVLAAQIKLTDGVEVHNPELHLVTCNSKAKLNIQMTIERGRGYVPAEQNHSEFKEIGNIAVDTIYSPVLKVAYRVEATRVEQRTDFDKLIIDVETKPSISPRRAMASAGSTLLELFGLVRELDTEVEGIELGSPLISAPVSEDFDLPVDSLGISTGPLNSLRQSGIRTIADLLKYTYDDLQKIKGMGEKKITGVVEALNAAGLTLKPSEED